MNLLFLAPQLPYPPRQGTALRNWGLIRHLSQRHTITLLTFTDEAASAIPPELTAVCARVRAVPVPRRTRAERLRALFSPHADLARRLWSPAFSRQLADTVRAASFDLVQIEGLEMAPYLAAIPPGPRRLYDAHNVEHMLQRRAARVDLARPARWPAALYSWLQWPRLKQLEAWTCRQVDAVTCVSAEDAASLRALVPGLEPCVIPNGIDVAGYASFLAPAPPPDDARPAAVIFTGKMDYRPNIDAVLWFAASVWPRVRAAQPQARFMIVGQKPTPAVQALDGRDGITVTGAVDDVRPLMAQAAVFVAPLRMGGGTRLKLLEAMALARPVVSTTLGAEGFPVQAGRELLLADAPADFARAVLRLLTDPAEARRLGLAGRDFVQGRYDWSALLPNLEAVYRRLRAPAGAG